MILQKLRFPLLFMLISLFLIKISMTSCASISSPSGGPKDTIAPILDTAFPTNFTTRFNTQQLRLVFNEYISLKSASQQITFSPPLQEKPEIQAKGKEIILSWKDTLLDNTTYTISFGNSITDFTEGNINDKFKYVFSTGDFIDSLELHGYVNGIDGEPAASIMVALYDYKTLENLDSIPFLNLPTYYAYTSESGHFELSNLKYSDFHVVAFEDTRRNFKMNSGNEKTAFLNDTLTTGLNHEMINLTAFLPAAQKRFYSARHVQANKIEVAYSYPVPNLWIDVMDTAQTERAFEFVTLNETSDTAFFWFEYGGQDSLQLLIHTDSTHTDTANVQLMDYDAKAFKLSLADNEVRFNDPVVIRANAPIKSVDSSLISVYSANDTSSVTVLPYKQYSLELQLQPDRRFDNYTLYIPENAVTGFSDVGNDSSTFTIETLKSEDLGNLNFIVNADSIYPLVLNIYNDDGQRIIHHQFTGYTLVKLQNQKAGEFEIELIVDKNGDGRWTTGNYLQRIQAEKIIHYDEAAEIRANWDLELEWRPEID